MRITLACIYCTTFLFSSIEATTGTPKPSTEQPETVVQRAYPSEKCQEIYAVIQDCQNSQPASYTDEERKRLVQLTNVLRAFSACRQEENIDCPESTELLQKVNWFMRRVDLQFPDGTSEFEKQKIDLYEELDPRCKKCIEKHKRSAIYSWCRGLEKFSWERTKTCFAT